MEKDSKYIASVDLQIHSNIMVCGATGFIGSHVVSQLLKLGYTNIHIIARNHDKCRALWGVAKYYGVEDKLDSLNIHYGSMENYRWLVDIFTDCTLVFNCAATVDMSNYKPNELIKNNVTLAYLVGEAAVEAGVDKLVHVSSISALDEQDYPAMTTEDNHIQSVKGKSAYTISKLYSENEIWRISEKGLKVVVVNPAVVLGVGDWSNSPSPNIIKTFSKGINCYTSGVMGYVMVDDVATAMIKLSICDEANGKRFILCSDNLSYKELSNLMANAFGKKAPMIKIPNGIISMLSKIIQLRSAMNIRSKYSKFILRNLITKRCYDGSKVTEYIDFKYSSMQELLSKTVSVFKR